MSRICRTWQIRPKRTSTSLVEAQGQKKTDHGTYHGQAPWPTKQRGFQASGRAGTPRLLNSSSKKINSAAPLKITKTCGSKTPKSLFKVLQRRTGHPRTSVLSFAVTLVHVGRYMVKYNRGLLPPTRSQPRLGLVARCGDLTLLTPTPRLEKAAQ